jgi:hypothetical protein
MPLILLPDLKLTNLKCSLVKYRRLIYQETLHSDNSSKWIFRLKVVYTLSWIQIQIRAKTHFLIQRWLSVLSIKKTHDQWGSSKLNKLLKARILYSCSIIIMIYKSGMYTICLAISVILPPSQRKKLNFSSSSGQ